VLLAAGFLRELDVRRRLQRRRRTDGHTIPTPNRKFAATETKLRVAADHDLAARLNAALRRATLEYRTRGAVDFGYRLARVTPAGLQLSTPAIPSADAGDTSLREHDPAVLLLDSEPAPDAPALLPLLLPVGRIGEHTLLLDLERIGNLALVGESSVVDDVLASVVSETLAAPWSDTTRVTVVCRNASTAPAVMQIAAAHPDRVSVLAEMTAQILGSLEHETRVLSRPRPSATTDPVLATRTSTRGEPHSAHLIILIDPLRPGEHKQLQEMQARLPRPGFSLVYATPAASASNALHVTRDAARLTPDHLDFIPYRITAPLAHDMSELLVLTEQPADAPLHTAPDVPDDGEHDASNGSDMPPVEQAAVETTDDTPPVVPADRFDPTLDTELAAYHDTSRTDIVRISLLGPPTVTAPGQLASNRRATSTEIVIYLATHPRGVDIADLEAAIWPHGAKASTVHPALARTRTWLGSNEQGEPNLPITSGGRLRLAATVLTDWNMFTRLVRRAEQRPNDAISDLTAALNLVQGRPFENLPTGRYGWLAENLLEQHIPTVVVDAAHRLAEILLDHGDITRAQQVSQLALSVDPYDERTWRDLMRAAAAQGNLLGVAKLRDQLVQLLGEDDEDELAPETLELLGALLPRTRVVNQ
jgi:DNA-binding SARP family transcriptional activator